MTARTSTPTLTDRYVEVAMRGAPPKQRADLELELRGLIEDSVEARRATGDDAGAAEVAALTELGNPERLAERYRGRTSYLVGPAYYHHWRNLVRLLLAVVVPIIAVLAGIGAAIDGDDVGDVVGSAIGAAFSVGVQVAFWTTLVFAVIERVEPDPGDDEPGWTPDDLPELHTGTVTLGETAFSVVVSALTIAAMLWQRGSTLVTDDGQPVAILDPDNWSFWWPFLIVLLVVDAIAAVVIYRQGRWTPATFAPYAVLQLVFAGTILWLLSQDELLNPAFLAQLDWEDVGDPGTILSGAIATGVVLITALDLGDTALSMWRARRVSPSAASGR